MLRQKILQAAMLVVLPAAAVAVPFAKATAAECRTKPGSSAATGKHWFYRVNRSDHQHCWYLGSAQTEQSSHARGAIPTVNRQLIRHSALRQPDGDKQTASTSPRPEEVVVQDSLPLMNFASRWANWTSQDFSAHGVAAIGYQDAYPATEADQVQFIGPADNANSVRPQYAFGKFAFAFLLLAGVLTTTLPPLASALLKVARRPSVSASKRFTTPNRPRNNRRLPRAGSSQTTSGRLSSRTQTGRSACQSSMAPDTSDDFEVGLKELMGALHRASAEPYTLRSFAPAARSRRFRRS
jgi:hypothetical protein